MSKVRSPQTRAIETADGLETPTDISVDGVAAVANEPNALLVDSFALYLKTKNFHWHVSGPHFRHYHVLLDEQAAQILAATDDMAERVRKIGATTLRSIGHVARLQRVQDNDADYVAPLDMLRELMADNKNFAASLRRAHGICDEHDDYRHSQSH